MDGHVAGAALLLLMSACAIGGLVQGSVGFGFSLVVVPVLTLIEPAALPATILVLAFPMASYLALRERHHIDFAGFASITAGRIVGTAGGAWILVALATDHLAIAIGVLVVLAVVASSLGLDLEPTRAVTFGAGIASGVMGTAAAVGGPALAMVYQRRPGPELRSTLNISFVVGLMLSLLALLAARKAAAWHAVLALELVPATALGLWASRRTARVLDRGWLRPTVLAFAGVAGTLIVVRGLAGA